MIIILVLQFLSAIGFILFKQTLNYGSPFFLVSIRMLLGCLPLLVYQLIRYPQSFRILRSGLIMPLFIAAFFNVYAANGYGLWAMQYTSASITSLIYNFSPFISALLGYFLLQEQMTYKKMAALIVGFIALLPLLFTDHIMTVDISSSRATATKLALLFSAASAAYGWISVKKLMVQYNMPNVMANGLTILLGGLIALMHAFVFEGMPQGDFSALLLTSALAAIISPAICYVLCGYVLMRFSATLLLFSGFLATIFTILLDVFLIGEPVSLLTIGCSAVALLSVYLFYLEEKGMTKNL